LLIDGDGHVWEDPAAIIDRLPDPYRDDFRTGRLHVPVHLQPQLDHMHAMPVAMRGFAEREDKNVGVRQWLDFVEAVGISKTVLYPTLALPNGKIRDKRYAVAFAQAYNDWIAETYVQDPSRRFQAAAVVPSLVPEEAAKELRRAKTELNLCAGFVATNSLPAHFGSPEYNVLWAEAEALDVPLAFHGGCHDGFGMDDFNVFAPVHALGHPFGLLTAMAALVFHGVYERFPRLRTAFLEGGSAWILTALERFDESIEAFPPYAGSGALELGGRDMTDYLIDLLSTGRITFGCEGGEKHLAYIVEYVGCTPFMYSSDFPHEVDVETCRHEIETLRDSSLSDTSKKAILSETAKRFYGLGEDS
jgi:predicted TIM-barrel fold metal-dependent hydrolase